jgi:hypothetical protein
MCSNTGIPSGSINVARTFWSGGSKSRISPVHCNHHHGGDRKYERQKEDDYKKIFLFHKLIVFVKFKVVIQY